MKPSIIALAPSALLAAAIPLPAAAGTITIAAFDSGHEVRSDSSSGNSEDRDTTVLGRVTSSRDHRPAAEFDLSGIPDGATITSVTFSFEVTGNDSSSVDYNDGSGDLSLHELTTDPDKVNGWNWYNASFGIDMNGTTAGDNTPFGTPGGDLSAVLSSIADTTFDPTSIAAGTTLTFGSTAGLVAAVQANLADDLLYFIAVNGSETASTSRSFLRVAQSSSTNPAFRINVAYVPEPGSMLLALTGFAWGVTRREGKRRDSRAKDR